MHSVIRLNIPPALARLMGDPCRVSRILQNLVGNAVKFTEHGEIQVIITVEKESSADIHLEIQIKDNGIGIDAEAQKQVFEQYTQADRAISRKYGGTGLGLTITKKLVELMGGNISLQSQLGVGSTFTVKIPFQKAQTGSVAIHTPQQLPSPSFENASVLVCEDDELSQQIIQRLLEKQGLKVEVAANGREGLARIRSQEFDAAFIDFQMPFLNGLELAAIVRKDANDKIAHMPLIAMTGSAHFFAELPVEKTDFNAYVIKPFTAQTLLQSLQKVLHKPEN